MKIFRKINEIDADKYILCKYFLSSSESLRDAAWGLSIGQSVGNPNVRNHWETDELFENHSCFVIGDEEKLKSIKEGEVTIAFPVVNTDFETDGVSHLLCQFMGGQMDIDIIDKCHLLEVVFPQHIEDNHFMKPKYGISGIRNFTGAHNKPLFGGIVKPKIGVNSDVLLEMVKEMVEGGINFIKEDEIMSNPTCCPIEERVPKIMEFLKDKNVIYAVCINCDPHHVIDRVKKVYELGANAVHINFWSGLGGYMSNNENELKNTLNVLHSRNVMPALSCGMHPGLVGAINKRFGTNYMANVGGAIHGHPNGSKSGAMAMRQAIDMHHSEEYRIAIKKWGALE